jgi:hypothetical protein
MPEAEGGRTADVGHRAQADLVHTLEAFDMQVS